MDTVALRAAKEQVQFYNSQSSEVLDRHNEAMECRDCEDLLALGIGAFRWITRAEQGWRQMIYDGKAKYDARTDQALAALYEGWMASCQQAEERIRVQLGRGFQLDNLDEFRACCEEAADILERREWEELAHRARMNSPEENDWEGA